MTSRSDFYKRAERRIETITLALGALAAMLTGVLYSWPAGLGVAAGALLAWLNSQWLRQGLDAMRDAAVAQHVADRPEASRAHVSPLLVAKLLGRYVLIGLIAYVIVAFFSVPVLSILAGFLSLGAAAMVEGVYEAVARP